MGIELTSIIVDDYDAAVQFFVDALGFRLSEDSESVDGDGGAKRWVVVHPPGGGAGLLLAKARGAEQEAMVGRQFAGRVGLFLRVEDFDAAFTRMTDYGVSFLSDPRDEPYGKVAMFVDLLGNKWDLLGPASA